MASLTGQTIQSTYDALLKISGNDALTSSLQRITDGLGNFSPLYLSTTAVEISSGLNVVGSITGSNLSGTNTGDETNSTIKSKLGAATSSNDGYLTSTDWSTFNAKQNALGYTPVPNTRSLTINGTAYDLSADRSWSVGTVTSVGLSVPTGFAVSNSPVTGSGTLGLSFAAGYSLPTNLSQASWDTAFSSRIATFTTTGNSGAATFASNTLNIPNYTLSGLGGVPTTRTLTINGTSYDLSADRSWTISTGLSGSGTTNYIPKFTGSTSLGNSLIFDNGSQIGIGTASPQVTFHSYGGALTVNDEGTYSARFSNNSNKGVVIGYDTTNNKGHIGSINPAVAWTDLILNANGGNVGIGTTTPGYRLDVAGSINGAANVYHLIGGNKAFAGDGSSFLYMFTGSTAFAIRNNADTSELVRITNGGNVGIGQSSPSFRLTTNFSAPTSFTNAAGDFVQMWQASGTNGLGVAMSTGDSVARLVTNNGYQLAIAAGGTETARFTSSGNVGIGTSSPIDRLTISGRVNILGANQNSMWFNQNAGGSSTGYIVGRSWSSNDAQDFFVYDVAAAAFRLNITSGGNVGIGTTSPTGELHIFGSNPALRLQGATTGNMQFGQWDGTNNRIQGSGRDFLLINTDATNMLFSTNNTERMRITSGGNVGIGTTSAANAISGTETVLKVSNSNIASLYLESTAAGAGMFAMYVNTARNLVFYDTTSATERMRITSGGNVGLNTSSPSYRLDVNGDIRSTGVIRVNTGTIDTVMTFDTGAGAIGTLTNHNLNFWINGTAQAKITTGNQFYVGTGVVNGSAKVQIDSTTQGFLPPRMTSLQRIAIATPAVGLIVYQTDNAGGLGGNEGLYVYKSGGWTFII